MKVSYQETKITEWEKTLLGTSEHWHAAQPLKRAKETKFHIPIYNELEAQYFVVAG